MPGLDDYAPVFGAIQRVPAAHIDRDVLAQADVLLVRSVTRVNRALLDRTPVRFVGSATAGIDHVDVEYLREAGVHFAHAPGSNAVSVVEYVLAAVAVLSTRYGRNVRRLTAGVVGCGQVGERLARRLQALGMRVLRNDPPRAERESGDFVTLEQVIQESDVISLHTPLTRLGPHPTHHLIGERELARMKPDAWLINAARGAVIDSSALLASLRGRAIQAAVLDVWEEEPEVDLALLDAVDLATPHIAGYSFDAKLAGTRQVMESLFAFLGMELPQDAAAAATPSDLVAADPALPWAESLRHYLDQMYAIQRDDARMRREIARSASVVEAFRHLRKAYPIRYTFGRYRIAPQLLPPGVATVVGQGLGVKTGGEVAAGASGAIAE